MRCSGFVYAELQHAFSGTDRIYGREQIRSVPSAGAHFEAAARGRAGLSRIRCPFDVRTSPHLGNRPCG